MLNDLKYALRVIRKHPLSNGVIVFTIACLVAVIGLIFASFRAQMGKQMPFDDPDRFVRFWRISKNVDLREFPSDMFHAFQKELDSFAKIGAMEPWARFTLTGAGEAATLTAVKCTAEVLEMTGFKPLQGRLFSKVDEEPGNRKIVILNEKIWDKHFASDPDILGKPITLNDKPYIVVGILPQAVASTHLAWSADMWIPHNWPEKTGERIRTVTIVGRIKPAKTIAEAQAELDVLAPRIEETRPKGERESRHFGGDNEWTAKLAKLDEHMNRRGANREQIFAMVFAFTLMGCVVLIACFNMTSLFLVQATSRAREMAVRLSVGASRWRIVRQMLQESVVLSLCGGAVGLMISFWLMKLGENEQLQLRFDPGLYGVAFASAIVIGAMVSILPAWRAGKADLSVALKDGGQSSATRQRHRLRNFLVGSQVGMATILTVAAVLFGRSFLYIYLTPINIDPERLVNITISPEHRRYQDGKAVSQLADRALRALSEMPGVEKAAVSSGEITSSWGAHYQVTFRDQSLNQGEDGAPRAMISYMSPGFTDMIGMKLRQGRPMSENQSEVLNEAVINQTFARTFFPEGIDPIGQEVALPKYHSKETPKYVTITGVVNDRNPRLHLRDANPEIFLSAQHPFKTMHQINTLVETKADAKEFGLAVRETLKRLDKSQPIGAFVTVRDIIERQMEPRRVATCMLLGMAGFGIFMALMGVYGVVAYAVIERTREMGIRMALGATRAMVVKMVMKEGTRLLVRGILPGILIAYGVTHGVPPEMVQHADPRDPVTYLLGFIAVAICGAVAALLPARRMINLKPNEALRYE